MSSLELGEQPTLRECELSRLSCDGKKDKTEAIYIQREY